MPSSPKYLGHHFRCLAYIYMCLAILVMYWRCIPWLLVLPGLELPRARSLHEVASKEQACVMATIRALIIQESVWMELTIVSLREMF